MTRGWLVIGCIVLAAACYVLLPAVTHYTAGFTMNAFDLAEWSSLHPSVRSDSPPMLTSFLLRVPLVILAVTLALAANSIQDTRWRWLIRVLALALMLRLIPPTDFLSSASADPNYRQMALLTVLGIVLVGVTVFIPASWQRWILLAGLTLGVIAGWMGLSRALVLLRDFQIDYQIGSGLIVLSLFGAVAVAASLWPGFSARRIISSNAS